MPSPSNLRDMGALAEAGDLAQDGLSGDWDMTTNSLGQKSILHICVREVLRPIRDQILRLSGYAVESTCDYAEALELFRAKPSDLVLLDIEQEEAIPAAERLCSEVKTVRHGQLVAFVCNWRVAILTDCPDEILRTEFDPAAFVAGVNKAFQEHRPPDPAA